MIGLIGYRVDRVEWGGGDRVDRVDWVGGTKKKGWTHRQTDILFYYYIRYKLNCTIFIFALHFYTLLDIICTFFLMSSSLSETIRRSNLFQCLFNSISINDNS